MPKHADVTLPAQTWTLLTDPADATITGVRIQNLSGYPVRLQAQAAALPAPSGVGAGAGGVMLDAKATLPATDTLANVFPGVTAPLHVYAWCDLPAELSVSHA